jgi:hypothetical protein
VVAALRRELGLTLRAVIATPLAGLAGAAAARAEVDRVFDSAERHPGAIGQVSSLDEARTTVLLDEIVSQVAGQPRLVDPRVRQLREQDPMLADTLPPQDLVGLVTSPRSRSDCMCTEHGAVSRPPHRKTAVHVVGRPRRPPGPALGLRRPS